MVSRNTHELNWIMGLVSYLRDEIRHLQGLLFFFINLFYFWLHRVFIAAHRLSLVGGERGLLFVAVRGLLTAVASFVAEHGLQ